MKGPLTFRGRKLRAKAAVFTRLKDPIIAVFGRVPPGSWLNAAVRAYSKATVGAVPYVFKIDLNRECNLSCAMCYAGPGGKEMPFEKVRDILDQVRGLPVRVDLLGGEPLMHGRVADIVRYAKRDCRVREVVLYTNGTLADAPLARDLARAGLDRAMVNLSSHDAARHDRFTGSPGSFDGTLRGIAALRAAGVRTNPFVVMHARNIDDRAAIRDFCARELGARALFYQYVPRMKDDPLAPDPARWLAVKNAALSESAAHAKSLMEILTFCGRVCLGGYYSLSVKTDGSVTPCPFIDDIVIGNAFERNVWDIFAARMECPDFAVFMAVPAECGPCASRASCSGGCRAGNRQYSGSYAARDYRCAGPWRGRTRRGNLAGRIPTYF